VVGEDARDLRQRGGGGRSGAARRRRRSLRIGQPLLQVELAELD